MAEYIRRDDAVKIAERYGLANGSVLGWHTGLADCIASEISGLPAADVAEARMDALVNANFGSTSLYSTLTFDIDYEVHTAAECRRERDNFYRRLIRRYPEAKLLIVYGQGKSTSRFHLHMISDGIPADEIAKIWGRGSVAESKHLRKHNFYLDENGNKVDHGADYTALSNYLHGHWRKEFGGHRYKASRTCIRPET